MSTYPGMRGWTCAYCGTFAAEGCTHYMSESGPIAAPPPPQATKLDPTLQYLALGERLVAVLERLVDLLAAERVAELEKEANR